MDIGEITYRMVMYFNCMFEIFLLYIFLEALFPVYEDRRNIRILKGWICITAIYMVNWLEIPIVNLLFVPILQILLYDSGGYRVYFSFYLSRVGN